MLFRSVIVVGVFILGAFAFAWNLPNTYAKQEDLRVQKENCDKNSKEAGDKLDKIISTTTEQRVDVKWIRQSLEEEIVRSQAKDRELGERIDRIVNGR